MKTLIKISTLSVILFFVCSCQKSDYVFSESTCGQNKTMQASTKSSGSERRFHWICKKCGMLNGGWNSNCVCCGTAYSPDMADLVLQMWMVADELIRTIDNPGGDNKGVEKEPAEGSIQISNTEFTAIQPPKWYDTSAAQKYYNQYMNNILLTDDYKEAFNYAWYKVTHILYPGKHMKTKVESEYNKWRLKVGNKLSGNTGSGLKDGSYAAVQAFINR